MTVTNPFGLDVRSSNPNLYSSVDSKQRFGYIYDSRNGKEEILVSSSDTPLYSSLTSARGSDITYSAANLFATSVPSYTAARSMSPSNQVERKRNSLLISSEKEIIALLSNATTILTSKEGRIDRACKYMEQVNHLQLDWQAVDIILGSQQRPLSSLSVWWRRMG